MPSQILEGLTALQAESKDITGLVNSISSSRNMGKDKEALKVMAKQAGMPEGYENAINMAKTEDDLGMISGQIMSKNGMMEQYGRIRGASSEFGGPSQSFEEFVSSTGRDITQMSDIDRMLAQEQYDNKVKGERTSSIINSDKIHSLSEAKSAIGLQGLTGGGKQMSALKQAKILHGMEDDNKKAENIEQRIDQKERDSALKKLDSSLGKDWRNSVNLGRDYAGLQSTMKRIFEDARSEGAINSDMDASKFVNTSIGPRVLGLISVGEGLPQNILDSAGKAFGVESIEKPELLQQSIKGALNRYMADYIRSMSGLAVSDNEFERIANSLGQNPTGNIGQITHEMEGQLDLQIRKAEDFKRIIESVGREKDRGKGSKNGDTWSKYFTSDMENVDNTLIMFKKAKEFFREMNKGAREAEKLRRSGGNKKVVPKEQKTLLEQGINAVTDILPGSKEVEEKVVDTGKKVRRKVATSLEDF